MSSTNEQANYREAQRREVAANLVRAAGVYANPQEARVCRLRLPRHARDRRLPVKRSVDEPVRELELANDYGVVDLRYDMRLEFLYRRLERGVVLREHEAPGRVAVETVDRLESRNLLLLAQDRLDALWIVARIYFLQAVYSWISMFIQFDHFCLLTGLLNPFTLNIISDMLGCTFAISLLCVSSLLSLLFPCSSFNVSFYNK